MGSAAGWGCLRILRRFVISWLRSDQEIVTTPFGLFPFLGKGPTARLTGWLRIARMGAALTVGYCLESEPVS